MKIRDIGLVLAGALGVAAVNILVPQIVTKAEAQAVGSTPGVNPVIVTSSTPISTSGSSGNGANTGVIVVNDPANKRITAVSYMFTYTVTLNGTTNTTLGLSPKQSFTY